MKFGGGGGEKEKVLADGTGWRQQHLHEKMPDPKRRGGGGWGLRRTMRNHRRKCAERGWKDVGERKAQIITIWGGESRRRVVHLKI